MSTQTAARRPKARPVPISIMIVGVIFFIILIAAILAPWIARYGYPAQ